MQSDPSLSATTVVQVEPPRARLTVSARLGLFTNFGAMAGPIGLFEALRAMPGRADAWSVGLMVAVLHNDLTTSAANDKALSDTMIEIGQVPVLAIVQYRRAGAAGRRPDRGRRRRLLAGAPRPAPQRRDRLARKPLDGARVAPPRCAPTSPSRLAPARWSWAPTTCGSISGARRRATTSGATASGSSVTAAIGWRGKKDASDHDQRRWFVLRAVARARPQPAGRQRPARGRRRQWLRRRAVAGPGRALRRRSARRSAVPHRRARRPTRLRGGTPVAIRLRSEPPPR